MRGHSAARTFRSRDAAARGPRSTSPHGFIPVPGNRQQTAIARQPLRAKSWVALAQRGGAETVRQTRRTWARPAIAAAGSPMRIAGCRACSDARENATRTLHVVVRRSQNKSAIISQHHYPQCRLADPAIQGETDSGPIQDRWTASTAWAIGEQPSLLDGTQNLEPPRTGHVAKGCQSGGPKLGRKNPPRRSLSGGQRAAGETGPPEERLLRSPSGESRPAAISPVPGTRCPEPTTNHRTIETPQRSVRVCRAESDANRAC